MKKVLSLVLVIAMVLSSFSFAFAAQFDDIADTNYEEAIDTLFALGVITGYEDGTYRPERTVTRAEMAKLMVELLGYGDLVAGSKSNFADTQGHWADEWIALSAGRGIVIGTGDGNFMPDALVTYDQVLTMLVRGLGYTDDSNELKSMTWPTNFKVKAAELNITKNVDMRSNDADRGGVAQAMYNALEQQIVKVDADGDIIKEYRIGREDGRDVQIPIRLISRIAIPNYDFIVGFEHINPADKNYAGDNVDLTPYLFQTVEAYFNKNNDKEIVYVGDIESLTYTGEFEDIDGNILEVGDYKFDISEALVSYNNDETTRSKFLELNDEDLENAKITVVLEEDETRVRDNADAAGIVVLKASAYVQVEEEYRTDAVELDGIFLPVKSGKVDSANLIVKGAVTDLDDIEEDDIVAAYAPLGDDPTVEDTGKLMLVVSRDAVEGKVTGTSGDDYYIDRVKYETNDYLNDVDFEIGDEGTFFLDDSGRIIAFTGESEGTKVYAVVDEMISGRYEVNNEKATVVRAPRVKLHTASNETITYAFDFDIEWDEDAGEWVIDNEDLEGLFVLANKDNKTDAGDRVISIVGDGLADDLVEYSLNNRTTEVTAIKKAGRPIDMRTNSTSFVLSSNAVIFNVDGKVIDEDDLGSTVTGEAVYQNGRIVALLADNVGDEGTLYYAYITKFDQDTDANGDEIQRLTAYINGSKNERLYTDDEDTVRNDGLKEVYVLKLNDNGTVTGKDTPVASTTATAIEAANTRYGEIKTGNPEAPTTLYFDQGATVIEIDEDGDIFVRNLNVIKEDTVFEYFGETDASGDVIVKFIIVDRR